MCYHMLGNFCGFANVANFLKIAKKKLISYWDMACRIAQFAKILFMKYSRRSDTHSIIILQCHSFIINTSIDKACVGNRSRSIS